MPLSLTIMQRPPAQLDDAVQFPGNPAAGQRGVGHQRQAFAAEVVDDHQHPEAPAVVQHVGHEVQAPALVRGLRHGHRCPGAERTLAAAALPHRQPLLR